MKRGFTLIELLAVIVILAIIALIAVPIVLNIIDDSKESSLLRSAEFYLDAVEYTIADAFLYHGGLPDNTYKITPDGDICKENETPCTDANTLKVEVNGDKPTGGTIAIKNGNVDDVSIILSEKTIVKNEDGELVFAGDVEQKLAPGLYDENDTLIVSWDLLVKDYDFENLVENGGYNSGATMGVAAQVIDENYSQASKLVIADSVTKVGKEAFMYCVNLKSVVIGQGVKKIDEQAFSYTSLDEVVLSNSVETIEKWAFEYSGVSSITFGNSLIRIGSTSFRESEFVILEIPDSVEIIEDTAFYESFSLTTLTIPKSVKTIEEDAFGYCENLTTINYKGTEAEWDAITKENGWDNGTPSNKVINFNYKG